MIKRIKLVWFEIRIFVVAVLSLTIGISYTVAYEGYKDLMNEYDKSIIIINEHFDKRDAGAVSASKEVSLDGDRDTFSLHEGDLSPSSVEEKITDMQLEDFEDIADIIFRLESSGGKNDSCRINGKYNGYGYAQSKFSWNCYDTQEEVRSLVIDWLKDKFNKKMLVSEALCYYNTGIVKSDCEYYDNFKILISNK